MGYAERNNPKSLRNGKRYKPKKVEEKKEDTLPGFDPLVMAAILSRVGRKRIIKRG